MLYTSRNTKDQLSTNDPRHNDVPKFHGWTLQSAAFLLPHSMQHGEMLSISYRICQIVCQIGNKNDCWVRIVRESELTSPSYNIPLPTRS